MSTKTTPTLYPLLIVPVPGYIIPILIALTGHLTGQARIKLHTPVPILRTVGQFSSDKAVVVSRLFYSKKIRKICGTTTSTMIQILTIAIALTVCSAIKIHYTDCCK